MASEIILTEPLMIPTASFIAMSREFDSIESRAILTLAFISVAVRQPSPNLGRIYIKSNFFSLTDRFRQ